MHSFLSVSFPFNVNFHPGMRPSAAAFLPCSAFLVRPFQGKQKSRGAKKMPRRLSAALYCKTLQTMSLSCGESRFAFANPAAHPHSKLKAYTQETFPDATAPRNLSIRTTDVLSRRSNNEPTREKASHQRISENSRVPVSAQALPFSRHFIIAPAGHTVKRRQSREGPQKPSFEAKKPKDLTLWQINV